MSNSDDAVLNERYVKIFLQSSSSRPDGPDPPFVSIAASKMRAYPYLHVLLVEQVVSALPIIFRGGGGGGGGSVSLTSGCFCFNIFKVFSVKDRIPFDMFSVKSFSAH